MVGTVGRSGGDRKTQVVDSGAKGEPPKKPIGLRGEVSSHWDSLISMLAKNELALIDVFELRILSNLLAQSDKLEETIANDPSDLKSGRLYLSVFKEIHRLSSVFGLNPADRKRLGVKDEEEHDPFLEYLNEAAGD